VIQHLAGRKFGGLRLVTDMTKKKQEDLDWKGIDFISADVC